MKKHLVPFVGLWVVLLGMLPIASSPTQAQQPSRGIQMAIWRPETGTWYVALANRNELGQPVLIAQTGTQGDVPVPGHYVHAFYDQFAVWRPTNRTFYISGDNKDWVNTSYSVVVAFGNWGDLPVPGDYDGDGLDELAVWNSTTGVWTVALENSLEPGKPVQNAQVGQVGDIPVPADYDGDGVDEIAVWRPADSTFYVSLENRDWVGSPVLIAPLGQPSDTPVPGDYDGDRVDEFAVWSPPTGEWTVLLDNDSGPDAQRLIVQTGMEGDRPVAGDYDGDGVDEAAVWRPTDGTFYVSLENRDWGGAGSFTQVVQWGQAGDIPVPATYRVVQTDQLTLENSTWLLGLSNAEILELQIQSQLEIVQEICDELQQANAALEGYQQTEPPQPPEDPLEDDDLPEIIEVTLQAPPSSGD